MWNSSSRISIGRVGNVEMTKDDILRVELYSWLGFYLGSQSAHVEVIDCKAAFRVFERSSRMSPLTSREILVCVRRAPGSGADDEPPEWLIKVPQVDSTSGCSGRSRIDQLRPQKSTRQQQQQKQPDSHLMLSRLHQVVRSRQLKLPSLVQQIPQFADGFVTHYFQWHKSDTNQLAGI